MQRINPVVAAILCGVAVGIALFAWLNRYEYRVVEVSPGVFYQTKRNTWTGLTCVVWVSPLGHTPPGLQACREDDP